MEKSVIIAEMEKRMSMNLNGKVKKTGEYVKLRQTPTWLSYMVIDSWEKNKKGRYKQRHWKDTRKLYLDWCYSFTQRAMTVEDSKVEHEWYDEHVKYIMSLGKIDWWVM